MFVATAFSGINYDFLNSNEFMFVHLQFINDFFSSLTLCVLLFVKGEPGAKGARGPQGNKGSTGDAGLHGAPGPVGLGGRRVSYYWPHY